mmetsp:Transcript_19744/g.21960  ORF Transcript_19744/g.21960 Transcript_19744/m.21960 type:complete len:321 (-) Transcript_19744:224-1186(-)
MSAREWHIVILGPRGAGKTSLLMRFILNTFSKNYVPTIVEDEWESKLTLHGRQYTVVFHDTQGFVKHLPDADIPPNLPFIDIDSVIRKGDAFIIVYDASSLQSFNTTNRLVDTINVVKKNEEIVPPMVLVANKCDTISREVMEQEGRYRAEGFKMLFAETSAENDVNIQDTFHAIVDRMTNPNLQIISDAKLKKRKFYTMSDEVKQCQYCKHKLKDLQRQQVKREGYLMMEHNTSKKKYNCFLFTNHLIGTIHKKCRFVFHLTPKVVELSKLSVVENGKPKYGLFFKSKQTGSYQCLYSDNEVELNAWFDAVTKTLERPL